VLNSANCDLDVCWLGYLQKKVERLTLKHASEAIHACHDDAHSELEERVKHAGGPPLLCS